MDQFTVKLHATADILVIFRKLDLNCHICELVFKGEKMQGRKMLLFNSEMKAIKSH